MIKSNLKFILGSQSPRRRELLSEIFPEFESISIVCDEVYPDMFKGKDIAIYLSELKSNAYSDLKSNEVLITADTIVCLEDKVLGKPKDYEDAFKMLTQLSGKSHSVFTGVCVRSLEKEITIVDETIVTFYDLSADEIDYYIRTFKPYDKAGSYGIQEWMGFVGVKKMEGDYYNVMGLPLHKLYRLLKIW